MKAVKLMTDEELATWRRRQRDEAIEVVARAQADVGRALDAVSKWSDAVSQVIERDLGIGPGDEHQSTRLSEPEYTSSLDVYAHVKQVAAELEQSHEMLQDLGCRACDAVIATAHGPDVLAAHQRGEGLRQVGTGDVICLRCGRTVSPAARERSDG